MLAFESHLINSKGAHWFAKRARPFVRYQWLRYLENINRNSEAPVVAPGGPIVSLTTFEPRWARVFYTLESIGAGTLKPSRLVLWVAPSVLKLGIPEQLIRLQQRGLEIRTCEDLGPHKKYFPLVNSLDRPEPFVTCDDDVLYPVDWLQRLVFASGVHPACVVAHRVRKVQLQSDGVISPYDRWPHVASDRPSFLNFAIGIGGVFYPSVMTAALSDAGEGFRLTCPRADDVWLKAISLRASVCVAQVSGSFLFLIDVPGMRSSGLAKSNVLGGGNDEQIAATFVERDLERLKIACGQVS